MIRNLFLCINSDTQIILSLIAGSISNDAARIGRGRKFDAQPISTQGGNGIALITK